MTRAYTVLCKIWLSSIKMASKNHEGPRIGNKTRKNSSNWKEINEVWRRSLETSTHMVFLVL
jgi:hypothetical protein